MASQVLSGSSDVSYTNNTGQNVRLIINYMTSKFISGSTYTLNVNWAGVTIGGTFSGFPEKIVTIGRNLAFSGDLYVPSNNALATGASATSSSPRIAYPTEIMLAPTQSFTAVCGAYNIIVIPEVG